MSSARARVAAGDLAGASDLVEQAARYWREQHAPAEEARCLRLAAALARHAGQSGDAVSLAARAVDRSADPGTLAEAARAALAAGDPTAAVAYLEPALADDQPASQRAELERWYAEALLAAGLADQAAAAYRRAASASPEPAEPLVDGVGRLQAAGLVDLADQLSAEAADLVEAAPTGAHPAASRLALLASARAVDQGDLAAARRCAERARAAALAGRSAAEYVSAAVAISALAEASADRVGAYASLAIGWATLRDLVGAEGARTAFQPPLLDLRQRWGTAGFAEVKGAYEARVLASREATDSRSGSS